MTRWLWALVGAVVVLGAGYFAFLNPDGVELHLTPARTANLPLAAALLGAFAAGGALVGSFAGVRAGARGWRRWRTAQRARREARRAAVVARAQHLVWAGDYRTARGELLRAEGGAVPSDASRLALLAEAHLYDDDPAGARRLLEEGLQQAGPEPRLLALLAEAAERMGDLGAAADALERTRAAHPESPRLARRLRDVHTAAGRWSEALAVQGEILLRVRDPATLAREEQVLRGLRYQAALAEPEPRRAARLCLAIAREDPGFVPASVSAGDLFERAGRRFTARRVWERGARRRAAVVLLERLERLNTSEGKPERTTRLYRRLGRRHPESAAVALLFARHLIAQGRLDEAEAALNTLPAAAAGHRLVHVLWAEAHRQRGNSSLAAETYARAFGADLGLVAPFRCAACRREAATWSGYCEECKRWGTFEAEVEQAS
ncbi:MAG: tetratricopeptide repeat protein [Deltaproteobacteria bacterium]|nr:MAG: tetratricopeptide repeat protein [Deltaproteobacteria bacterium]